MAHRELAESREALLRTHNRLQQELRDAERYVRAILPAPIASRSPSTGSSCRPPSSAATRSAITGSIAEHFALYLLDVCGHGVGAALLSVAVTNTLRSGALPHTDFRLPEEVLGSLNQAYQMEHHDDMYFTIWYGVYHPPTGRLRYASAGHPPPILVTGPSREARRREAAAGAGTCRSGMLPTPAIAARSARSLAPARLFLFSDGVYEIHRPDDSMLPFAAFEEVLTRPVPDGGRNWTSSFVSRRRSAGALLEDDFSIVKMTI